MPTHTYEMDMLVIYHKFWSFPHRCSEYSVYHRHLLRYVHVPRLELLRDDVLEIVGTLER